MLAQIVGRGTDHAADRTDLDGRESRIRQMADAHRHIHALFHDVDRAVHEESPGPHARIEIEIFGNDGQHMQLPEQQGRRHRQRARGLVVMAGRSRFGFGDFSEDATAVFQIARPGFSGLDRTRGAYQQPRTDQFFQPRHGAGDHRCTQLHLPRRLGKTGSLGHLHEDSHCQPSVHVPSFPACRRRSHYALFRGIRTEDLPGPSYRPHSASSRRGASVPEGLAGRAQHSSTSPSPTLACGGFR